MKEKEFVDVLNEKIKYIEGIPYYNDKVKLKKILDGLLYIRDELSILYDRVEDGEVLPNEFEILSKEQFDLVEQCSEFYKKDDVKRCSDVMKALFSNIVDFELLYDENVIKMAEVTLHGCPNVYIIYFEDVFRRKK
ncbi:MAG: hypothetical protein ACLTON_00395 [Christensenellales bacterium]|jgi:hypothetical protein